MTQQKSLPKSVALRLENIVQIAGKNPDSKKKQIAYSNLLNIIASMISATSGSLLFYDEKTFFSTNISEYDSRKSGILERRDDHGETYDEREYKILFKWINGNNHQPLTLHLDQLPINSTERREFQTYAIQTALYLPIIDDNQNFRAYIELWESRYKRFYTEQERSDLMQATQYITQVTML